MSHTLTTADRVLEYRRPRPLDRAERSLAQIMQLREAAYQAAAWTMLALGCVALLLGPTLAASIVLGVEHRIGVHNPLGWWTCFALAILTLVPLLFWMEVRTHGQWFETEIREQGSSLEVLWQASSRGEWELRRTEAQWAVLIELLLWGPRMILTARERWKHLVSAATLHDAAAVLSFLRHFEGGVATRELPTVQPLRVLCYLVSRDWVGVSKDGDRVWLLSQARKDLAFE